MYCRKISRYLYWTLSGVPQSGTISCYAKLLAMTQEPRVFSPPPRALPPHAVYTKNARRACFFSLVQFYRNCQLYVRLFVHVLSWNTVLFVQLFAPSPVAWRRGATPPPSAWPRTKNSGQTVFQWFKSPGINLLSVLSARTLYDAVAIMAFWWGYLAQEMTFATSK